MKTIIALATTTLLVNSALMQPAVAQRRTGNQYSVMGENEFQVEVQFSLFDKNNDGTTITNSAIDKPNSGIFKGAIENYKSIRADACRASDASIFPCNSGNLVGKYFFDDSGFLLLKNVDTTPLIVGNGDLYTQFIPNDPLFGGRDSIGYSIFKSGETATTLSSYRLDFLILGIDKDKAINDLSYILQQNLFTKSRVFKTDFNNVRIALGDILLQNRFEEDIKNIPEPQAITGVFVLGAFGIMSFVKRNKKRATKL
ncbi:hypothetical protein [Dendronalium sp. ChiSLP03b]|uniref:hypothetical protein n=1 Tax=Dendronalium sp. ChiSLP03b TaxID=3075381 RepID=UPI002AD50900|nr:hypothetical protein [Dendronalium sp. ChiSLP03b]MDZ8206916.1 hypothetical protein [Dendronalium sp. ChiSLP03b]